MRIRSSLLIGLASAAVLIGSSGVVLIATSAAADAAGSPGKARRPVSRRRLIAGHNAWLAYRHVRTA